MSVLNIDFNLVTDGETKSYNVPVSEDYMLYAVGAFGGGVLSLEASPDNGVNWFTVDQLSEAGRLIRYLVSGEKIRICLDGAISPNINTGVRQ